MNQIIFHTAWYILILVSFYEVYLYLQKDKKSAFWIIAWIFFLISLILILYTMEIT